MKHFFDCANEYVRQSDWKTLAALKLCLCSMGLMLGMAAPKKARKPLALTAAAVFAATYVPLMLKYLRIYKKDAER